MPPSDLPPGIDAEFTVQNEPSEIQATVHCNERTPQAARDCFNQMLLAIRRVRPAG